jgi:integral membrane sensor domain MASE1
MSGTLQGLRPRRPRGWWLRPLAVAAGYYGVGRLVWLVAGSPGHATPLWPPAGLTLALLLLTQDFALCMGAALGGFGLMLQACMTTAGGLGWGRASAVAAVFGIAAAAEPLVAAHLARRFVRLPWGLGQTRTMVRFALLAGPGPAALGAALAAGALFWAGLIPLDHLPREAVLWWTGDMLGLLLFAPLGMVLGADRTDVPWRRRVMVAVPVILMTAAALTLFVRANRWDQRRGDSIVRERAEALTGAVERSLLYNLDALRTAADYLGSARVDGETFRRVATGTVVRHFAYTALAWAPAAVEGKPVPVEMVDPTAADPRLPGQDLGSDPARQAVLSAARHSGEAVGMDAPQDARALWIFVPAPGSNGDNGVSGFVGGLLRVDLLVDRAMTGIDRHGMGIELREGGGVRTLHRVAGTPTSGAVPLPARTLTIAGRAFAVVPMVGGLTLAVERSGEAWIVLVTGMLLVALLQGVLLVVTGREEAEDTVVDQAEWPAAYQTKPRSPRPAAYQKARSPRR